MKNLNYLKHITLTLMFLSFFMTNAQSDLEILNKVDNTKSFTSADLVQMDRNFSNFAVLLRMSGLENSLNSAAEHTLFVPTNEALNQLSVDKFAELTNTKNRAKLIDFVKYHYIPNKVEKWRFKENDVIDEAGTRKEIKISNNGDEIYIGGARVISDAIETSNGIIYVVNRMIAPSSDVVMD